jgi:Raf kinase inhibitor-like YbhB/YbcL family protein
MDDPDAAAPKPFVHWIMYNIPASVTALREGFPTEPTVPDSKGIAQGTNSTGSTGCFGPKPPVDDPAHNYHFRIFALDVEKLGIDPGATREQVLAAMDDHVLAEGEIVAAFERPAVAEANK